MKPWKWITAAIAAILAFLSIFGRRSTGNSRVEKAQDKAEAAGQAAIRRQAQAAEQGVKDDLAKTRADDPDARLRDALRRARARRAARDKGVPGSGG